MRSAICVSDRRSSLRYFFRMGTVWRSIKLLTLWPVTRLTVAECEIDGVASVYSELFTNPFLAWGKYRRGLFKTTLPISFQFHHAQMDGFEAARFLNGLQETVNGLTIG